MSELVAKNLLRMLDEANGIIEIQRNELAGQLGCVPSQINYVLDSRFTPEHGYLVESRRGGGGYIRITRVKMTKNTMFMHIINSIGTRIDARSTYAILNNMLENGLIDEQAAHLLSAALSDNAYSAIDCSKRDQLRAAILKNMLLTMI